MSIELAGNYLGTYSTSYGTTAGHTYSIPLTMHTTGVIQTAFFSFEFGFNYKWAIFSDNSGPDVRLDYDNTGNAGNGPETAVVNDILASEGDVLWFAIMTSANENMQTYTTGNELATRYDDTSTTYSGGIPSSISVSSDISSKYWSVAFLGVPEKAAGSFSGTGSFPDQNFGWQVLASSFSGSGAFSGLTGQLHREHISQSNNRLYAMPAERYRGCIFADNFISNRTVHKNAGELTGTPTVGRRATFNGSSQAIYYPAQATSDYFSIVTRFKATAGGPIVSTADLDGGTPSDGFDLWVDSDGVHATHSAGISIATECLVSGSFLDDEWHTVTYSVDLNGGTHVLYVDSSSDSEATTQAGPIGASSQIKIGGIGSRCITGSVDGIRIYNTSLTEKEHDLYDS